MENNYKEYLDSFAWKAIKQVKLSEQPECECCREKASTVHHLSYERRWSEKEEDIVSVCERCHHECHFVNWYQIKNDEDILRKRFEEVRDNYFDNWIMIDDERDKYEVKDKIVYKNWFELENLWLGFYSDWINLFYYFYEYVTDDSYWEEEEYYSRLKREDEYNEKYWNWFENDGSYNPIYDWDDWDYFIENDNDDEEFNDNNWYSWDSLFSKHKSVLVFENQDWGGGRYETEIIYKFKKIRPHDIKIIWEGYIRILNDILYYAWEKNFFIIEWCHADSFEIKKNNYAKDKNFSYKDWKKLISVEWNNLNIINDYFAEDGIYIYCLREKYVIPSKSELCYNEKTIIIDKYIKNNNNFYVYYDAALKNIEWLDNLDLKSFKVINYSFIKDKNFVYYDKKYYSYTPIIWINSDYFEIIDNIFAKDNKNVICFYKNYSNNEYSLEYKVLVWIDSNSFEIINKEFIKDKDFVYFLPDESNKSNIVLVNWVNSYLFEIPTSDSHNWYYWNKIFKSENYVFFYNSDNKTFNLLKWADPSTFQCIYWNYNKDKYSVYFKENKINFANSESFEKINDYLAKDNCNVYYKDELLIWADNKSFEILLRDFYKDKNSIYYENKILNWVDVKTFEVLGYNYSKDKKNIYYKNELLNWVDVNSFQVLWWSDYSKDKNTIYHKWNILEWFDKKTFTEIYKEDTHSLFIDKNHLYFIDWNRENNLNIVNNVDWDSFKLISKYTKKIDDWDFRWYYIYWFEWEDKKNIYNVFNDLYTYERKDQERTEDRLIIKITPKD